MNRHSLHEQNFTNLEQLRAYHNEHFIRLAYQAILGREVEAEGLHHYLSLFRQNLSRTEFLAALRASPEAQFRWQRIEHEPSQTDGLISFDQLQFSDELKDITPQARNIYFQLKSATVIHTTRRDV